MEDTVTVIIPARNEQDYVGSLLEDLRGQTHEPAEIIVVDGESEDATAEVVERFPNVLFLDAPASVSAQRNLGAARATGDVLLFLDADARLPHAAFLENFLREFRENKLDLACPYFASETAMLSVKALDLLVNGMFRLVQGTPMASGGGSCLAVRREVFEEGGPFDEELALAEDAKLIRTLARRHAFGILGERVLVSDRRYREHGVLNMFASYTAVSACVVLGRFELARRAQNFGGYKER